MSGESTQQSLLTLLIYWLVGVSWYLFWNERSIFQGKLRTLRLVGKIVAAIPELVMAGLLISGGLDS